MANSMMIARLSLTSLANTINRSPCLFVTVLEIRNEFNIQPVEADQEGTLSNVPLLDTPVFALFVQ